MSNCKDQRLIKSAQRKTGQNSKIPEGIPFVWFTKDMLESVAFRALSGNARKVLDRILIEHMAHAGTENGNLVSTYDQIVKYGVRRQSIQACLNELNYMGFIRVKKGWAFRGNHPPSRYRLTWLGTADGLPATNEWKSITDSHIKAYRFKVKAQNQSARKQRLQKKQNASLPDNVVKMRLKGADCG